MVHLQFRAFSVASAFLMQHLSPKECFIVLQMEHHFLKLPSIAVCKKLTTIKIIEINIQFQKKSANDVIFWLLSEAFEGNFSAWTKVLYYDSL